VTLGVDAGCGSPKCGYVFEITPYKTYEGQGNGMSNAACRAKCNAASKCWGYTASGTVQAGVQYWSYDLFDSSASTATLTPHHSSGAIACSGYCI